MHAGDFNIQSCSTSPRRCIVANCNELLDSSTMLSHFLTTHQKSDNVEFQSIQLNEKILMVVSVHESFLQLNQNVCLGVLGLRLDGRDGHVNVLLKDDFAPFTHHIPILIMACRGNYGEIHSSPTYETNNDFVCFWLVTPELKKPQKLSAILTIHDEEQHNSVSMSIDPRKISGCHQVSEFMHSDTDFLIVNSGILQNIVNDDSLFLEVIVKKNLY